MEGAIAHPAVMLIGRPVKRKSLTCFIPYNDQAVVDFTAITWCSSRTPKVFAPQTEKIIHHHHERNDSSLDYSSVLAVQKPIQSAESGSELNSFQALV